MKVVLFFRKETETLVSAETMKISVKVEIDYSFMKLVDFLERSPKNWIIS